METTSTAGNQSVRIVLPREDAITVSVFEDDGTLARVDLIPEHVASLVSLGLDLDPEACSDGVPFLEVVVEDDVQAWADEVELTRSEVALALANACVDAVVHTLDKVEARVLGTDDDSSKEA